MRLNELPAELTKMYMKRSSPIKACALIRYNVTDPSQVVIASTNEVGGNCIMWSFSSFTLVFCTVLWYGTHLNT